MIRRAERKRKSPMRIKKEAKKRYTVRLLSFRARTAQRAPIITKRNYRSTESREIPVRVPRRKAMPVIMVTRPAAKTRWAATRRKRYIYF
jgi:hypothetical protein